MWIVLVGLYGVIKGARDIIKKKSLLINTPIEVLFFYTLLSFIMVTPGIKNAVSLDMSYMGLIILKSFIIFVGWIGGYKAMTKLPVSLYGIMDMSRVLFAAGLGVLLLGETFSVNRTVGMLMVLAGLLLVNLRHDKSEKQGIKLSVILMMLLCCVCNAGSEILDKYLMPHMSSTQLQFWYMLYLVLFYFLYIIITKTKLNWKTMVKNYWIWISAVLFVVGDKALFVACADKNSTVIAMTLIKQCSVLLTILGGKLVFKEKHIIYRLLCAAVIIAGIIVAV